MGAILEAEHVSILIIQTLSNNWCLFPNTDCDEDLESVHDGMDELVGSTTTKRTRARQLLKTPAKKVWMWVFRVRCVCVFHYMCLCSISASVMQGLRISVVSQNIIAQRHFQTWKFLKTA